MKHKHTLVRMVMLLALLATGLTVAAVPGAAQEFSATLYIYGEESTNAGAIVLVHQVYYDWAESTVTWNNFYANAAPQYAPTAAGSFASGTDWLSVDITALVQAWMAGTSNYGVLLEQDLTGFTRYSSSEGLVSPYLRLCTDGVCEDLYPAEDAYIRSLYSPDGNYNTDELWTGLYGQIVKQTLLKFDIPVTPPSGGCTLTPGYWKTHSMYGPAPYDPTWALVGENTAFFLSGQSYYQVLWEEPAGGHAYYILAHAYIAAELNFLNGADPSAAQSAFDQATTLFNSYTPDEVAAMKKTDKAMRATFVSLAEILDNYNNGLIGPGHCEE